MFSITTFLLKASVLVLKAVVLMNTVFTVALLLWPEASVDAAYLPIYGLIWGALPATALLGLYALIHKRNIMPGGRMQQAVLVIATIASYAVVAITIYLTGA